MASDVRSEAQGSLGRVLIIDDDEVARNMIANHVGRMGYEACDLCADGEEGWQAIKAQAYDLVVLDWKLPKISGLALFNRIRRRAASRTTPLLVVSGLLDKHDFRLLQEFPCTALVEKPFTAMLLQNRVEELTRESIWYGQNVALIDAILTAVQQDGRKAEQLLSQVLKKAPNPIPVALAAARRLIKAKLLKSARAILEAVLKVDDTSVLALNELGKVLHLLGRHDKALELLRRANKLSPQNIQRLCLMGEVELNMADPEAAAATFRQALEIDAEDVKAQAGQVVAENMLELMDAPEPLQVQLPRSFASLLNTMGIAFVRNGDFKRGIGQYQAALAFLQGQDDAARVAFNLGLGFLRWGRSADALTWFRKSEALAPEGFGKAATYVRQLLMAGGGAESRIKEAEFARSGPRTASERAEALAGDGNLHDEVESAQGRDDQAAVPVGALVDEEPVEEEAKAASATVLL